MSVMTDFGPAQTWESVFELGLALRLWRWLRRRGLEYAPDCWRRTKRARATAMKTVPATMQTCAEISDQKGSHLTL